MLLAMKWQITWQERDLNIRSQDLNQLAASQLELPRKLSGTGRTEITTTKKFWEFTSKLKQAKGHIPGPSAKRMKDLLKLNRDQFRWVVGLLTGHCHIKGQLFELGLADEPT
jgi:hypothetical protein